MTQQKPPKWLINFTRKDLVTASWGSDKGADLLYHLIHKASREVENKGLPETLKDVKFQEKQQKMRELATVSVGTLHTYLKYFVSVGYVSNEPYSKDFEVHLAVIEKAFSKTPAKPGISQEENTEKPARKPRTKKNVSEIETMKLVTLPLEELDKLYSKMFQLNDLFQSLNEKYSDLKEKFTNLCTLKSTRSAQNADAKPFSDSLYDSVCFGYDSDFFGARESDPVAEDQPSTEEKNSYSQEPNQPNETKNETPSQFGGFMSSLIEETESSLTALEQQLFASSGDSWLQEMTIAEPPPSQVSVPTLQVTPPITEPATSLFPDEEKPAKQHTFGNLRESLGTPDVRQITPAQQKKLDAAEKRHKEAAEKKRKEDIWILYGKLTGSKAIRDLWSEKAVKALAEGEATDEQITQTYTWLKAKKMSTTLSYIASNLNSCVASTKPAEKPKSELKDFTHMTDEEFEAWRRRA